MYECKSRLCPHIIYLILRVFRDLRGENYLTVPPGRVITIDYFYLRILCGEYHSFVDLFLRALRDLRGERRYTVTQECPTYWIGSVNVNVEPFPCSLSTQIFPPCISTNFLVKVSPRPVPSLFWA